MSHRRIRTKSNYDPQGFFQHNVAASQRKGQTIRPKSSNLSTSGVRPSASSLEAARQLLIDYHYFTYPHNLTSNSNWFDIATIAFVSTSPLVISDHTISFLNYRIFEHFVDQFHNLYQNDILPWLNGRSIGPGSYVNIRCTNYSLFCQYNRDIQITKLYHGSIANDFGQPFITDHTLFCQYLKWNDELETVGVVANEYTRAITTSEVNHYIYYHNWGTPFTDCIFSLRLADAQQIQTYFGMDSESFDPELFPGSFLQLYYTNVTQPSDPSYNIVCNFAFNFDMYIVPA